MLASSGLAAAVAALASRSIPAAALTADGLNRYPEDVERAVYFCCAEALKNAARHAPGAAAALVLAETDGQLSFSVADDGPGFDVPGAQQGAGLQNMRDRLSVLGGRLEIRAWPSGGTTVSGLIPVATETEPRWRPEADAPLQSGSSRPPLVAVAEPA